MTTLTNLFSFTSSVGSLIMDAAGNLFSTTGGGTNGRGTVVELVKTDSGYASTVTTLFTSDPSNGYLGGRLTMDAAGNLFGTTLLAGASGTDGEVFEIAKTGAGYASTPTILATFTNSWSGPLLVDAAGNLFGSTGGGGANGKGMVFEIAKTASGYTAPTTLASFNGSNGAQPSGPLIMDAAGNLLGTTAFGGAYGGDSGYGTVLEIAKTASGYAGTPTTLVNFWADLGWEPDSVVMDAAGDIFGTSLERGGANGNGYGTVFEIAKTANGYASAPTTLWVFDGTNGANPRGLLIDAAGNPLGTASASPGNGGILFELSGWGPTTVSIGGTAQEGQTLTAIASSVVDRYQWQVLLSGTWVNITEATSAGFVVSRADDGRRIRVLVTDTLGNTVSSAPTNAVLDAAGNQPVYETVELSMIGNGQYQRVYGSAISTTVNSGGEQDIYSIGAAADCTVNAGGTQIDWGA